MLSSRLNEVKEKNQLFSSHTKTKDTWKLYVIRKENKQRNCKDRTFNVESWLPLLLKCFVYWTFVLRPEWPLPEAHRENEGMEVCFHPRLEGGKVRVQEGRSGTQSKDVNWLRPILSDKCMSKLLNLGRVGIKLDFVLDSQPRKCWDACTPRYTPCMIHSNWEHAKTSTHGHTLWCKSGCYVCVPR